MSASVAAVKVPALVAAMIAEYIAYFPPNPPPSKEETEKYNGGDIISRIVSFVPTLATIYSWTVHGCEIAALIAQQIHSPSSSKVLSALFARPAAVTELVVHPIFLLGTAMLLFGAAVRKVCYITLGRYFTFQLAILKEHKLVTWGPYAVVRHPSYTGMLSAISGMLLMHLAPGGWLAVSGVLDTTAGRVSVVGFVVWMVLMMVGIASRPRKEDRVLKAEFGKQWEEWAKKTPYALVPYVY
ncbi:hypothetical protein BN946_scf184901.g3 [Trametes cinnabarina]|uniref:Protein-S-isoprenylcysteine O-methyltransferase n=1 Tax=Pycnoporus cinnabarinus TaxID=5643 RepID=A0A060SRU8_PYCCI|nr:hypothetical protein BN946_scf184901.g3 [Trametes cinnabarina]